MIILPRTYATVPVIEFVSQLNLNGVHATRRTQFGSEIDAACGQLHAEYVKTKKRNNAK